MIIGCNMTLNDFKEYNTNNFISKEKFWFENEKVSFWYRIHIVTYVLHIDWHSNIKTKYQILVVVDDDSINEFYRNTLYFPERFGFFMKDVVKDGEFKQETAEKILNSALKLKIENKIKVNNYQKINGILKGTPFYDN